MLSSSTSFYSSHHRILSLLPFVVYGSLEGLPCKIFILDVNPDCLDFSCSSLPFFYANAAVERAPRIPMLLTLGDKSFIVTNPWSSPSPSPSRTNKGRLRRRTKYKLRPPTAKSEAIPVAMNAEDEAVVAFCVQASWSSIRTLMVTNLIAQEFSVTSWGTSNSSWIVYFPALPHSEPSVVEIRSQILPPCCVYSSKQNPVVRMQGTKVTSASSNEYGAVTVPWTDTLPSPAQEALMLEREKIPELHDVDPNRNAGHDAVDEAIKRCKASSQRKRKKEESVDDFMADIDYCQLFC
jgi:hypothetical protein